MFTKVVSLILQFSKTKLSSHFHNRAYGLTDPTGPTQAERKSKEESKEYLYGVGISDTHEVEEKGEDLTQGNRSKS